jgi:membrane AbrB-like protein
MPRLPDRRTAAWALLTAAIAVAGGGLFAWLGLPAAWLTGATTATAAAALAGLRVGLPPGPREGAFLLLGISIGSSVTPESLTAMRTWPGSVALLVASIAATLLASSAWLERVHGWDRTTARFAAMPGAFSAVAVIAATSSADLPRVILAQTLRVFTLVALMPPLLGHAGAAAGGAPAEVNTLAGAALVLAASGAVALLLHRLGVPAGTMLGAMAASAALHASGLVHGRFPPLLVVLGFVATGAVIGARFRGTTLGTVARTVPGAVVSILLALLVSAGFAAAGVLLLGLPFGQLWLAYVLNLEPAFVGAHHILRILGLNLVAPFWLRGTRPL